MVGGKLDKSTSTCLVPGGTLLIHRSSFSSMFNTGTDKLSKEKKESESDTSCSNLASGMFSLD